MTSKLALSPSTPPSRIASVAMFSAGAESCVAGLPASA